LFFPGAFAISRAELQRQSASARRCSTWIAEIAIKEAIEQKVRAARVKEQKLEKKQARIEQRAMDGMDGPRPCLFMGGKPVSYWTKQTRM